MSADTSTIADDANIARAAEIVATYVKHSNLPAADLPKLLTAVHAQLAALGAGSPAYMPQPESQKASPAAIKRSITPDALISFIDGKPYKALKRHLRQHGLDAQTYHERYGLPADYPMTSPNYSAQRSAMAKEFGLGRPGVRKAAE